MKRIYLALFLILFYALLQYFIIGIERTNTGLYIMVDYRIYNAISWMENKYIQIDSN